MKKEKTRSLRPPVTKEGKYMNIYSPMNKFPTLRVPIITAAPKKNDNKIRETKKSLSCRQGDFGDCKVMENLGRAA